MSKMSQGRDFSEETWIMLFSTVYRSARGVIIVRKTCFKGEPGSLENYVRQHCEEYELIANN